MSLVTNVLLSFSTLEDADSRVPEVNAHIDVYGFSGGQELGNIWDSRAYGGHKHMEVPLYGAAFNYVSVRDFCAAVRAAGWDEPHHVRVFVCDQEDPTFEQVDPWA